MDTRAPIYDLFISYCHEDRAWVDQWLLPQLRGAKVKVFIDEEDLAIGAPLIDTIESAISQSRWTLLVLTQDWLNSNWTRFEADLAQVDGDFRRVLVAKLGPCEIPPRYRTQAYADFTDPDNWDQELERLLKALQAPLVGEVPGAAAPEAAGQTRKDAPRFALSEISSHLDTAFGALSLGDLAARSKEIEGEIQSLLYKFVINELARVFRNLVRLQENHFRIRDTIYQIKIGPRIAKPTIEVCILASDDPEALPPLPWPRIEIEGWGSFKRIEFGINQELETAEDRIASIARWVYVTAYRWLEHLVLKKLNDFEMSCSAALYDHLHTLFSAASMDALADDVWLAVFSEDHGYYLLDRDSAKRIVEILARSPTFSSEWGPVYHMLKLVGLKMPYDKSASRRAIEKGNYHEFSLPKVRYVDDKLDLVKTEEQMAQDDRFGVYPISLRGRLKLVAALPPKYKNEILDILRSGRKDLERTFESKIAELSEYVLLLEKNFSAMDWSRNGSLSELVGGRAQSPTGPTSSFTEINEG